MKQAVTQEAIAGFCHRTLEALLRDWNAPPSGIVDMLRLQRRMAINVRSVVAAAEVTSWAVELEEQVAAWIAMTDRYLTWIEILAEKTLEELAPLGPEALLAILQDLSRAPSLHDLAHGQVS